MGRFASLGSNSRCVPEKFASTTPGCDKSYEPSPLSFTSPLRTLVDQSSDARQLRGTSYDLSISVTGGDVSANSPLPSRHVVGIFVGSLAKSEKSAAGTADPTHE